MAVTQNIIPVSVESRFIGVSDHTHVMAGNVAIDYVQITLDDEWSGLKSFVTFTGCAPESTTVDYTTDAIEIPWEQITDAGDLYIGIQGFEATADVTVDTEGQLVTNGTAATLNAAAMTVPIQVFESSESGGTSPSQPTQGTLVRVEQDILKLEELTEGADKTIARINTACDGAEAATVTANTAATNADTATAAANTATEKATAATTAATTATTDAKNATDAANTAATTATTAASNADTATANATTATAAAQKVVDDEAGHRAAAKASADAAAASEAAAAKSATAAASSATAASTSEASASSHDANAGASSNSAASSASAASSSATAASGYADRAEAAAKKAETIAGLTIDETVIEGSKNPTAGGGIYSYVQSTVATLRDGLVRVVDALPDTGESGVIYMVLSSSGKTGDLYSEYVWINSAWEKLGDVQMPDLSPYAKTTDVDAKLAGYVTTSTLDNYATTAALAKKQDTLTFDGTPTDGSSNPVTSSGIKSYIDALHTALATVATTGRYADLTGTPTTATSTADGLMSAADKAKLDSLIDGDSTGF